MTKRFKLDPCLYLEPNSRGRDLVVGDLHGHRGLLEDALDRIGFDQDRDRVLSVGDLINRGPQSLATLSLLEQPWFHAVLGNHELMLLNFLGFYDSRVHSRKSFAFGGGEWIKDAIAKHPKVVARLAERAAALPLTIHVDGDVPFNVAHSELHWACCTRDNPPSAKRICAHGADAITTSRVTFASALHADVISLQFDQHRIQVSDSPLGVLPITYVGHSPSEQVIVHESYVHIDQGVGAATSRRCLPMPPTVLDHRRFAFWLNGVARARSSLDSISDSVAVAATT